MSRKSASMILLVVLLGGLITRAGIEAYRIYLDRWEGSLRAPLIVGLVFAIIFIIVGTSIVTMQDRAGGRARAGK